MRADFPQKIGDRKLNRFPSPSENIDLGLFISRSEGFYKINKNIYKLEQLEFKFPRYKGAMLQSQFNRKVGLESIGIEEQ